MRVSRRGVWSPLLALALSVGGPKALARTPRSGSPPTGALAPLTPAALERMAPNLDAVMWSGEGRLSGVVQAEGAAPARWSLEVETGREILSPGRPDASPSPDGRHLVFRQDGGWWLEALASGRQRRLGVATAGALLVQPASWSRDSRWVAIIETIRGPDEPVPPPVTTAGGVRFQDVGAFADATSRTKRGFDGHRVVVFEVATGRTLQEISVPEDTLFKGSWGAGAAFFFVPVRMPHYGHETYTAVRRLDVLTGEISEVYRQPGAMQSAGPSISPDGRSLALNVDVDGQRWEDFVSLIVVDLESGAVRRLTHEHYLSGAPIWARDGRELYFVARNGGLNRIHAADLGGTIRPLTSGARHHFDVQLSPDGDRLSYQTADGAGRRDVRVRDLRTGKESVLKVLQDPAAQFRLGAFEPVTWRATDGLPVRGFLIFPPDFDPTRKYPVFVDVHGGGPGSSLKLRSLFSPGSPLGWHLLAAQGYLVFVPDMRSSGEYGPAVAAARYARDDWDVSGMVPDADDVDAGVTWLARRSYVDAGRVGIMGHSAGGGRVNYLLTRTHRYAAGIVHDPIPAGALPTHLALITGAATGEHLGKFGISTIAQRPEAYTNHFMLDGYLSRTPTLIIVGNPARGAMVPLSAEALFSMLRSFDVPARFLRYPDDGHTPESRASALHRYAEVLSWLKRYAPPQASPTA